MAKSKHKGNKSPSTCTPNATHVEETCPICEKVIREPSSSSPGDDALQCEGSCHSWVHRTCSGVTKANYTKLSASSIPFYCHVCLTDLYLTEKKTLITQIESLTKELADIKSHLMISDSITSQSSSVNSKPLDLYSHVASRHASPSCDNNPGTTVQSRNSLSAPSKLSLVVYGIPECRKGTPLTDRCRQDLDNVASLFSELDSNISLQSLTNCFRLGKYNESQRSRPLLVKFIRFTDVSSVLSKRGSLEHPYLIKTLMSPAERKCEHILLKERWSLISRVLTRVT